MSFSLDKEKASQYSYFRNMTGNPTGTLKARHDETGFRIDLHDQSAMGNNELPDRLLLISLQLQC